LSEAKMQKPEGEWATEKHVRGCLGLHGRHVPTLVAAGLLDRLDDGRIVVHQWEQWQDPRRDHDDAYRGAHRAELAAKERARRTREKAGRGEDHGERMVSSAYTYTETETETETERDSPSLRPDLAALTARGWRFTPKQAALLADFADLERRSEYDALSGFEAIAGWVADAPTKGDLIALLKQRHRALKAERRAGADAREAEYQRRKAAEAAQFPRVPG